MVFECLPYLVDPLFGGTVEQRAIHPWTILVEEIDSELLKLFQRAKIDRRLYISSGIPRVSGVSVALFDQPKGRIQF